MDDIDTANASMVDDTLPPVKPKRWALAENGFVVDVQSSFDRLRHPFGDEAAGKTVLDVSNTTCAVGYMVDHKGNVAPAAGRTDALLPHEPAYHDHSNPPALPTAAVAAALLGNEPHPLVKAGAEQDGGAQDNQATGTEADRTDGDTEDKLRNEHPVAGLVQEHGVVQGETRTDDVPG